MDKHLKIGCIFLASGVSRRFCGNKLMAEFDGKPLIWHAIKTVPLELFHKTIVVAHDESVINTAKVMGMDVFINKDYQEGISSSVKAGLKALGDLDGYMFAVCDQPLRKKSSVARLVELFINNPENIAAMSFNGQRGNPVIFPNSFKDLLMGLDRDKGGGYIVSQNEDKVILCEACSRVEMLDVDYKSDIERLKKTDL